MNIGKNHLTKNYQACKHIEITTSNLANWTVLQIINVNLRKAKKVTNRPKLLDLQGEQANNSKDEDN